jgi:8-oxo-dGTP pyrophosphatase MutT (NUDIX family)
MNCNLIDQLEENLKKPLPGIEAQYKMAPVIRFPMKMEDYMKKNPFISAVLILLYPNKTKWYTVLMQRNEYNGMHSNQVSFPGGKMENSDKDTAATAIREAEEELGIHFASLKILGKLSDFYVQPSNYLIHPYVGAIDYRPEFIPDNNEVRELIETPVEILTKPETIKHKEFSVLDGFTFKAPYFDINGYVVWGATAMIISEFLAVINR